MQKTQPTTLTSTEAQRYARHLSLPEIGVAGQQQLKTASVLVVGAGGLGCPALLYLTAAGIGRIGVIDGDVVELSNLQRQVLFTEADLGANKAQRAITHLQARNNLTDFVCYAHHLDSKNAQEIGTGYDIILDCTDDFTTRFLINDTCLQLQKPSVFASINQFEGQCALFCTPNGPCYRCLYEHEPKSNQIPTCGEAGILGVVAGLLGMLQAAETIKWLLQIGTLLSNQVLTINALTLDIQRYQLNANPCCSHSTQPQASSQRACSTPCHQHEIAEITPIDLKPLLEQESIFLLDVREPHEYKQRHLNGYLIPLCELRERLAEIPQNKPIVIHCKSGMRSLRAAKMLIDAGFNDVKNLSGGILACKF